MWYCIFNFISVLVFLLFQLSQLNNLFFSHLHLFINNIIIPFKNTDTRNISKKPVLKNNENEYFWEAEVFLFLIIRLWSASALVYRMQVSWCYSGTVFCSSLFKKSLDWNRTCDWALWFPAAWRWTSAMCLWSVLTSHHRRPQPRPDGANSSKSVNPSAKVNPLCSWKMNLWKKQIWA